jgi:predicted RecB family nuclease
MVQSIRKPNPRGRPRADRDRVAYALALADVGVLLETAAEIAGIGRSTAYRARIHTVLPLMGYRGLLGEFGPEPT